MHFGLLWIVILLVQWTKAANYCDTDTQVSFSTIQDGSIYDFEVWGIEIGEEAGEAVLTMRLLPWRLWGLVPPYVFRYIVA